MTCIIDDCRTPATRIVKGHPDDVELCDNHLWAACDCWDCWGDEQGDPRCPLHGDVSARSRVRVVTP